VEAWQWEGGGVAVDSDEERQPGVGFTTLGALGVPL
jgi:hypothetical protein